MTPRENMLKALRHETPDYVPIVAVCDPHNQPSRRDMPPELTERLGKVQWRDAGAIHLARWLGIEAFGRTTLPIRTVNRACDAHTEWDDGGRHTWWKTPRGEVHERWRRTSADGPMFNAEHFIKGEADLRILGEVFADQEFELDPGGLEAVRERRGLLGDDGILGSSRRSPPATTSSSSCPPSRPAPSPTWSSSSTSAASIVTSREIRRLSPSRRARPRRTPRCCRAPARSSAH